MPVIFPWISGLNRGSNTKPSKAGHTGLFHVHLPESKIRYCRLYLRHKGEFKLRIITLPCLLLICACVQATEVFRCTQANGTTTFSQQPCGPGAVVESVRPPIVESEKGQTGRSAVEQLENYREQVKRINRLTGNKKQKENHKSAPCDDVTSLELRNARVSKELMACQSMNDVRHIYGTPESVSTWSSRKAYDTRWLFREENGRVYVYFKNGRVTSWNTHSD